MSKRMRMILLSMVTACLCLMLVVGATYALFSGSVTVNNHLQAGTLEVGLERVGFQSCTLDNDGTLAVGEKDTTTVDLVKDASTLFQMDTIVPGCWYEAELRVSNNGDVAFDYGMRILWNESTNASVLQLALAEQIQITVTFDGEQKGQFMLDSAQDVNLGSILAGSAAQTFTIRAEFVNDLANNEAQNAALDFDLQVYATQKIEK